MTNEVEVNGRNGELTLNLGSGPAGGLPENIQWMPPGRHVVWPDGFEKPFETEVTPGMAAQANGQLQELRARAAAGSGNWPYGDFDHQDREQSFEPLEFYWGGDDPRTGGIRLRVRWSGPGEEAVKGRAFRSFSPRWRMHKGTHDFLGIGLNVGGLVNRSAFQSIQAVARGAAQMGAQTTHSMTEQEKQEITNMITGAVKPLTDTVTALAKLPERLSALETAAAAKGAAVAKPDEKIVQLETRIKQLEEGDKTVVMANAKRTVEEIGVRAGRIAPQDKDTIEFWTGAIAVNAKAADALSKVPVNPALLTVVQGGAVAGSAGAAGESEFVAKAKEFGKAHAIADELEAQARFAGTKDGRRLYDAYRSDLAPK